MSDQPPEFLARVQLWLLTGPVLLTHAAVVFLAVVDRLVFAPQANTPFPLLNQIVEDRAWVWLNVFILVFLIAALAEQHRAALVTALSASFGVLVAWGGIAMLWGLLAPQPVSLLGPALAIITGIGSRLLAFGVTDGLIRPGPGTGRWRR